MVRLLRPDGGLAMIGQSQSARQKGKRLTPEQLGQWTAESNAGPWSIESRNGLWAMLRREPLPGGGEWTQLYANAGHTACSNDTIQGPMTLQWFGAPGPRRIIDRHHRPMSSLAKDGRIFVPADDAVIAVDAFNGTRLWETDVPNSRRIGAMKNSGQMLIEGEDLYIAAEDQCWAIDAATGQRTAVIEMPRINGAESCHWGYLNCVGDRLFGTGVKPTATFTKTWTGGASYLEGDFRPVVIGQSVFSVDRHTGETLWTYQKGAVMNSAIAIGQGRIYFAESRRPEVVSDDDGRVRIDDFCKGPTTARRPRPCDRATPCGSGRSIFLTNTSCSWSPPEIPCWSRDRTTKMRRSITVWTHSTARPANRVGRIGSSPRIFRGPSRPDRKGAMANSGSIRWSWGTKSISDPTGSISPRARRSPTTSIGAGTGAAG